MSRRWVIAGLLAAAGLGAAWNWRAYWLLPWFENKFERQFAVPNIEPDSLAALLGEGRGDLLLLDTRSPEEFRVSRIEGAVRVDWRQQGEEFCRRFGGDVRGKRVILYCSVGYRSSVLLDNVRSCLERSGAEGAANLSGGIFSWYNQGRTVVAPDGEPTDSIHPYDSRWGHLVKRR